MSYALFDDAGKFLAGRVMTHTDSSMQIELESGRRVKVKTAHVLLRFEAPDPTQLLDDARALAVEVDPELAWEFAPESDFGFAELAREYFDAKAGAVQQAAMLLSLFQAPHYFKRVGKGVFHKAGRETVQAALAAIERKKAQAAQVDAWAGELVQGECAEPIRAQLYRILFKPDKNSTEYKAVVEAARRAQHAPLDLLRAAGAIESPYQFHWRRFLYEQFPRGTGFGELPAPPDPEDELPLADAQAFSIDDSSTTEIDDALSVRGLGQGTVVFGIHIAAPALAITPDSALDRMARERLSTVYMPGHKITMLPDAVVQRFTLTAGRTVPAISLYVEIDESDLTLRRFETRIERLFIASNLRHDQLDSHVTEASLTGDAAADYPHAAELSFVFRLARELKARREQVRGKPEIFNRPDYNFRLDGSGDEPRGDETVQITPRVRGAPLDLIVSEAMILANSHWGGWLGEHNVPAIYRSQASMAPGVKVRMGTKPAPHAGMGVSQYSWATSPLRRYVDLVNQWQIVACVRHGRTAALAAPFKARDASLFSIISSFDAAYAAYNDFQHTVERYWTLRWLEQHGVRELQATTVRDGLVRADTLPLIFKATGCEPLPRGTPVRVTLQSLDTLTLEVHAKLLAQLGTDVAPAAAESDDDEAAAQPLALQLAMDVDEGAGAAAPPEPDAVAQ